MLISFINFLTAIVWRLIKFLLSLIFAGVCFVAFVFMLICVLIIIFGSNMPTIWGKDISEK